MFSYPDSAEVFDGLGDKLIQALRAAVTGGAEDLKLYREKFPQWVADHSERGLANWIHDRLWARLVGLLDEAPGVVISAGEPTREVTVGTRYRLRMKRHDEDGSVSTYETQTALEFNMQGIQEKFPGWEELRLNAGYRWNPETREMGAPLLSLRDGLNKKVIWVEELPDLGQASGKVTVPVVPNPSLPKIEVNVETDSDAPEATST